MSKRPRRHSSNPYLLRSYRLLWPIINDGRPVLHVRVIGRRWWHWLSVMWASGTLMVLRHWHPIYLLLVSMVASIMINIHRVSPRFVGRCWGELSRVRIDRRAGLRRCAWSATVRILGWVRPGLIHRSGVFRTMWRVDMRCRFGKGPTLMVLGRTVWVGERRQRGRRMAWRL